MPRDRVTAEVAEEVIRLDGQQCVGPIIGLPGPCEGWGELDHIMNGGTGKRGPSVVGNLVSLCSAHHRYKTDHAKEVRPMLLRWVEIRSKE